MKKIMMIAAFVVAALTANAQREVGQFTIQPKAGFGLSTVTKIDDSKLTVAAMIGGEVEYQIADIISVAGGLNFSLQGYDKKDEGPVTDWRHDLGYINIPIVCNVYFAKGWAVKAGLQPGFLVYSSRVYKSGGVKYEFDNKDGLNTFDLSIPIGVSYEFAKVPIVVDARYNFGVTKVMKDSDKSNRNSVFMVTCGYRFNL